MQRNKPMQLVFNRKWILRRAVEKVRHGLDALMDVPETMAWLVFMVLAANALAFIVAFSNPVIQSDAWFFLDAFVRKALDGTLHLGDFFVQRGGMDHAQPLRKLILLIELKHFDLDFRFEAVAGWIGAIGIIMILRRLVFWHESPDRTARGVRVWILAALCLALFSMNSYTVWTWPLMTGSFTSFVLMFATILCLWQWLALGRPAWLIISAIAFDFAADDTAILANIACLLALGIVAWQHRTWRKRALAGAGMLIASLIIVRISYGLLFTPPVRSLMPFGTRLAHLWSAFTDGGWWKWPIIPLASSVAQIHSLRTFVGHHAGSVQVAIGLILLAFHAWFWWRVLWKRPAMTAPAFAAIVVMLVFYAMLAGIVYGRVSTFGNNYLHQPRYVLLYSFNLVALLLMSAACNWDEKRTGKVASVPLVATIALFACWQAPLVKSAWQTGPYIKAYQQRMAWQIGQLARNPAVVPAHCLPQLVVCRYPARKRAELIELLESHKLNVFSARFQRSNRLHPDHPPQ